MEEFVKQRHQKLKELQKKGVNPYGGKFVSSGSIGHYLEHFQENESVSVAGRIMTYRGHGKAVFADIHDFTGKIQVYAREDRLVVDKFLLFKSIDIGDIIGVKGTLFKTRTGEPTILLENFEYLCKALRPLPEKWHGLRDVELRYRQRYLDLLVNKEVKELFVKRSKIITAIRTFLDTQGFLEVETPMMQPIPGGAVARPFATHHTALDADLYLRIAPELYLKRLLVGGFEKVYEINRNFRNEGISKVHNPEFTMLEVYAAYEDYLYMMDITELLITTIAQEVLDTLKLQCGDAPTIDLTPPWSRQSIYEAILKHTGVDLQKEAPSNYRKVAEKLGIEVESGVIPAKVVEEIFKEKVERNLIQPTFIIDYPIELCPLSKSKKDMPSYAERFELFINGQELANAYSELNDPVEQRQRFTEQLANDPTGVRKLDEDFVLALEYGMSPAAGLGIGIDRLVMVLTGRESIREVILFPQLKPVT